MISESYFPNCSGFIFFAVAASASIRPTPGPLHQERRSSPCCKKYNDNAMIGNRFFLAFFLPFGDVFGWVALPCDGVEDQSELTALLPWGDTVEADVELGAVSGVGVLGMGVGNAKGVSLGKFGAVETRLERGLLCMFDALGIPWFSSHHFYVTSLAIRPGSRSGPVTHTDQLVEPESGRASVLLGHAVNAGVEHSASSGIGVGIKPVQARAQVTGALGCL